MSHVVLQIWRHLNPANGINGTEVLLQLTEGQGSLKVGLDYNREDSHLLPRGSSFQSLEGIAKPGIVRVTVIEAKGYNPSRDSLRPYVTLKSGDKEHKTSYCPRSMGAECSW